MGHGNYSRGGLHGSVESLLGMEALDEMLALVFWGWVGGCGLNVGGAFWTNFVYFSFILEN